MNKKQTEAQRLADELESTWCDESCVLENKAAALLRRQDELLGQALEALAALHDDARLVQQGTMAAFAMTLRMEDAEDAITAIRAHREEK